MNLKDQVKNVVYFEVEYGSEFQKEVFEDLWKAIVIWALQHREVKHKNNKIIFFPNKNNLLPVTNKDE